MTDLHNEDSLVDFARREIQTRIENGVYLPGSKLSALDISNSLGISRTPVVSALNQLVAQGFAEKTSPRSTVVTQLHLSQVKEILQVREMIEMYASELIVKNAREVFGLTTRNRINKGFPGHTPLFLCPEIRAVRHRMAA